MRYEGEMLWKMDRAEVVLSNSIIHMVDQELVFHFNVVNLFFISYLIPFSIFECATKASIVSDHVE